VSPATGVFFRCLFGLPLLVLVARGEVRSLGPMSRRTVELSAIAGVFFAVDLITFHIVVDLMGAGLATVMGNLQVVIVALAAWLLLGERPRRQVFIAIPVMLTGVVLISGVVGAEAYGQDPRVGVAIGLVTAVAYSGYLLVIRRASPDHRPAGPVAIATAVTAVIAGLLGAATGTLDLSPGWPALGYLIAYGVVSQSIGYVAIQAALPRLPAVISSVLLLVQPVATLVLGVVLLGEDPSGEQLAGVLLVVGGIAIATGAFARLAAAAGLRRAPDAAA
jgi:drug/metabolite transporter (DMT)-like permease